MNESCLPTEDDPLVGITVSGRYRFCELADRDAVSALYKGMDDQTHSPVGIRVTHTPEAHRRLHEWLGEAILSRGKDAILAVGHIDRRLSFIVFAEAALEYMRPPSKLDKDEPEARQASRRSIFTFLKKER